GTRKILFHKLLQTQRAICGAKQINRTRLIADMDGKAGRCVSMGRSLYSARPDSLTVTEPPMKFGMAVSTILIVSAAFVQYSAASIATFENFPETSAMKAPFVEPTTSVTFSNPQNSAGYFGIDFGAATTNVPDLPGHILTGNGVALGNQFGLGQNFGFDAALSSAASNVQLDLIYLNVNTSAGTITLTSFDSTGKQVSTSTITPTRTTGAGYLETTLESKLV